MKEGLEKVTTSSSIVGLQSTLKPVISEIRGWGSTHTSDDGCEWQKKNIVYNENWTLFSFGLYIRTSESLVRSFASTREDRTAATHWVWREGLPLPAVEIQSWPFIWHIQLLQFSIHTECQNNVTPASNTRSWFHRRSHQMRFPHKWYKPCTSLQPKYTRYGLEITYIHTIMIVTLKYKRFLSS
jgi:hypothetical protein